MSDLVLAARADGAELVVEMAGVPAGTIALTQLDAHDYAMAWHLEPHRPEVVEQALAGAVEHVFAALGAHRLETRIAAVDVATQRIAARVGLRREGLLRSADREQVLMSRIAGDPPVGSAEGFIAMLNAGLPKKRVISQGLLFDEHGRVLLCELTYKRERDLPGGVVEPGESPTAGLIREVGEELGLAVEVHGLRTVNWLRPWNHWDDACVFLFDLGQIPAAASEQMRLQRTEIAAVHWCDDVDVAKRAAAATAALLTDLPRTDAAYREGGVAPVLSSRR